jgi:hypothetical protein
LGDHFNVHVGAPSNLDQAGVNSLAIDHQNFIGGALREESARERENKSEPD